jgi:hypothetical protein
MLCSSSQRPICKLVNLVTNDLGNCLEMKKLRYFYTDCSIRCNRAIQSLLEYEINWWVDKNKSVVLKGFNEKKRVNGCFVKMEGEPTLMIVTEIKLTFHGKEIYLPTEFCASHVSSTQILCCNLLFDFQWMSPNTSSCCSTPKRRKP